MTVKFQTYSFIPTVDDNVYFHALDTDGQMWTYTGKDGAGKDTWARMDMPNKNVDSCDLKKLVRTKKGRV